MANLPLLPLLLHLLLHFSWFSVSFCSHNNLNTNEPIMVSTKHYAETTLGPCEWRYIRVDLPPGFASVTLNLTSDVKIDKRSMESFPRSELPVICFGSGIPPVPEVLNTSLTVLSALADDVIVDIQAHQLVEQCHPLEENINVTLTNEQIFSRVFYVGLFNGIGPARTQSKMILRGSQFSFSAHLSVKECPSSPTSTTRGQYCNQTILPLSCSDSNVYMKISNHSDAGMFNQTTEKVATCKNSYEASCIERRPALGYSLDITRIIEQLKIVAVEVNTNDKRYKNSTWEGSRIIYVRYEAIPSSALHDYAIDVRRLPLVIQSPKIGSWYITLLPGKQSKGQGVKKNKVITANRCYSLHWKVLECPREKSGPNCTWDVYMLQPSIPGSHLESYFWSIGENVSQETSNFHLEPLLSKSSGGDKLEYAWTYFVLDIPHAESGVNIHVQLSSDAILDYELYTRFGGLPSTDTWDCFYTNKTVISNGSVLFKLYHSSKKVVSFYILYAKEGIWSFGLRHQVSAGTYERQTFMSVSSHRCPNGCSSHGTCKYRVDTSEMALYSYCSCDLDHGGFDCSIEMVSLTGHILQSIALVASNGAAILPALWTLQQKAFIEFVLFTFSGISSAFYHACDSEVWCAVSLSDLQFLDFWLSFMVVASTFIYLATVDKVWKGVIHICVAIFTAFLAVTTPTRIYNIILVIAVGVLVLLFSWLPATTIRSISLPNLSYMLRQLTLEPATTIRRGNIKERLYNSIKTICSRIRWGCVLVGFVALLLAGLSWIFVTAESYWIWHSVWHICAYTSSFFFLCSKVGNVNSSS